MTQPIGILGGTFDPVHNGHLHLATTFLKELDLAEIRFVPLNNPPHRPAPVASSEQRLEMLNLAIENHTHFKVDDCELQKEEVSYTVDTLKLLRKNIDDTPLCMLIGMDSFKTLNNWHQWRSLLNFAHIVIANRPGANEEMVSEIQELMNSHMTKSVIDLHQQAAGCIMKLDIAMLDISSTQIRNNFQSHLKSESLLPNKVLDFIQAHHLYNN
jgi:nicotinate-nucleotide adenylyltransferase